ncbi:MAG: hypothetical protein Q8R28_11975, partial [Dehalococcoidia bacterium]|nr:hypothetical protein [Dehalococcoidia bacterium]
IEPTDALALDGEAVAVESTDALGLDGEAGEVELTVSRFRSFDTIRRFTAAVGSLPGVTGTRSRRLDLGTLHLSLECEAGVPLVDLLGELPDFDLTVHALAHHRIEATLRDSDGPSEGSPDNNGISQDWGEEA